MAMTKRKEKKRKEFMDKRRADADAGKEVKLTQKEFSKTAEGRPKFVSSGSGGGRVSNEEFEREKKLTDTANDPAIKRRENIQEVKIQQEEAQLVQEFPELNKPIPTQETTLLHPIGTPEGNAQVREEINRRAGVQEGKQYDTGILGYSFEKNVDEVKKIFEWSKVTTTEMASRLPFGLGGFIGTDSKKISEIKSSLDKRKEIFSNIATQVEQGVISAEEGLFVLRNLEQDLYDTEEEIQQRAVLSASFRRDRGIEDIQTTMLQQRVDMFRARQRILLTAGGVA